MLAGSVVMPGMPPCMLGERPFAAAPARAGVGAATKPNSDRTGAGMVGCTRVARRGVAGETILPPAGSRPGVRDTAVSLELLLLTLTLGGAVRSGGAS